MIGLTHSWLRPTELPAEAFAAAVKDIQRVLKNADIPLAGFEVTASRCSPVTPSFLTPSAVPGASHSRFTRSSLIAGAAPRSSRSARRRGCHMTLQLRYRWVFRCTGGSAC